LRAPGLVACVRCVTGCATHCYRPAATCLPPACHLVLLFTCLPLPHTATCCRFCHACLPCTALTTVTCRACLHRVVLCRVAMLQDRFWMECLPTYYWIPCLPTACAACRGATCPCYRASPPLSATYSGCLPAPPAPHTCGRPAQHRRICCRYTLPPAAPRERLRISALARCCRITSRHHPHCHPLPLVHLRFYAHFCACYLPAAYLPLPTAPPAFRFLRHYRFRRTIATHTRLPAVYHRIYCRLHRHHLYVLRFTCAPPHTSRSWVPPPALPLWCRCYHAAVLCHPFLVGGMRSTERYTPRIRPAALRCSYRCASFFHAPYHNALTAAAARWCVHSAGDGVCSCRSTCYHCLHILHSLLQCHSLPLPPPTTTTFLPPLPLFTCHTDTTPLLHRCLGTFLQITLPTACTFTTACHHHAVLTCHQDFHKYRMHACLPPFALLHHSCIR